MGRYPKDIYKFLISLLLLSSVAAFTNCQCNAKRNPYFSKPITPSTTIPLAPTKAALAMNDEVAETGPSEPVLQPTGALTDPTPSISDDTIQPEPTMPPTATSAAPVEPVLAITDEMIEAVRQEGIEHTFLADLLLQLQQGQPVDINAVDTSSESYHCTALHHAILLQMSDVVEILFKEGCNVNLAEKKNGATPLHWALCLGNNLMIDQLLRRPNIDINAQTKSGVTYLYIAASKANLAAVNKLLQYSGIDVEKATYYGETPLACVLGQCSQSDLPVEEQDNYQKVISAIKKSLKE
jgi:hypothetical protein